MAESDYKKISILRLEVVDPGKLKWYFDVFICFGRH